MIKKGADEAPFFVVAAEELNTMGDALHCHFLITVVIMMLHN